MGDDNRDSSSGGTAIILVFGAVVAILIPCCGGLLLLSMGWVRFSWQATPALPAPPPVVVPMTPPGGPTSTSPSPLGRVVIIQLQDDGILTVDKTPVKAEELAAALAKIQAEYPQPIVVTLVTPKDAPAAEVQALVELLKGQVDSAHLVLTAAP